MLLALSRKLGVASNDLVRKATEFQRVVEVRCGSSLASLNLSSSATAVICLEIAANSCDLPVPKVRQHVLVLLLFRLWFIKAKYTCLVYI